MINFVEEFKKEKMSTGRRLAKRSIIGTKVCAPGPDGLWYSGVIQDVKASPTSTITSGAAAAIADSADTPNADTKYIVRFDFKTQQSSEQQQTNKSVIMDTRRFIANVHISPAQTLRRNAMIKEFRETDLIGPGFRSINGIQLQPGQRVYLTYNGRETSGDVIQHDIENDEVSVKIIVIGTEEPIELKKRLEEVRLLESRRSARLADQDRDTDFARLADMGGDRRKTSHSIEVPYSMTLPHNSRKRPTSYTHDCSGNQCNEDEMNECHAAMILMKLHNSPKSPTNGEKWLGSSPGSSSASWSSGSSSPPLSDDGQIIGGVLNDANLRIRTTSVSTSDEGIVVDFTEDVPRKKKANRSRFRCTWKRCNHYENTASKIEIHIREQHLGKKKPKRSQDQDGLLSESDHEEEFYYTEEDDDDDDVNKTPSPTSPPTLSHRDMARPPHEDPEYQRQIVGNFKQGRNCQQKQQQHNLGRLVGNTVNHQISNSQQLQQLESNNTSCTPTSPLAHHNYTWPSNAAVATTSTPVTLHQSQSQTHNQVSYIKHARSSPRPSHSTAPYPSPTYVLQQHHNYSSSPTSSCSSSSTGSIHSSPNSSASNVLQQLTTHQNITVTTHHTGNNNNNNNQQTLQQQQQHHAQMSTVTITPNYHHHPSSQQQQHSRGNLQHCNIGTASNIVSTTTSNIHHPQHPQHTVVQQVVAGTKQAPNSPHRRTRGENKKCRKVYGMERRDLWCTQCKWKKACSRFGD